MTNFVVFGDAEAAVCDVLRNAAEVQEFAPVSVATDLKGYSYPARRLRVTRTGGVPTLWMRVDNPTIDILSLAETKAVAYDLAAAARGVLFAARSTNIGQGLRLYDIADAAGLTWAPDDDDPDVSSYTIRLSLVTRPL